ncbi:DUF4381 domain-containing protein [Psychromonas sp. B3M02]|uniref:DUF4381 domain-containing protein n=1 Tax=Psychromonas sp. B3M02 TaxID=2267226 RepID=UPI000DEA8A53|nr:DUF4381 domain-containing protein [Psychromonas sp. B3M02]RBW46106.1 DUF4381 domain-containing protein [Psychromonas sp. B3M02]
MPTSNNPFEQIILPTQAPSAWPPAPIYWVILGAMLMLLALFVWLFKQHQKKQKKTKQALVALKQLRQQATPRFAELNKLLKGLALQYYPRHQVASLTGEAWFNFIQAHHTGSTPLFGEQTQFCQRLYQQPSMCDEQDFKSVSHWIKGFPAQVKRLKKSTSVDQSLTGQHHV